VAGFLLAIDGLAGRGKAVRNAAQAGRSRALQKAGILALRELEAALFEQHLRGMGFLVSDRPTVADIACFPYVALAPDGSVSLDPYPGIRKWMRSLRALDGFIEMPGIHRLHELKPEPSEPSARE
jgi:glutathione S-transferase